MLLFDTEISGWASLIMTVVFFGGVQLIILGILRIYLGKIFKQTEERPSYIIRSKLLILLYFIEMILLSFDVRRI